VIIFPHNCASLIISCHNCCNQPFFALYFSVWEISQGFYSQRGNRPPPFFRNRPENHSHNLGSIRRRDGLNQNWLPITLSLSHIYPFHLSIPFTILSLYLSYPSLPLYIFPSTFLSLSLLSIILFGVYNGGFHPCFHNIRYDLKGNRRLFFSTISLF
jgi:hypothetical protein